MGRIRFVCLLIPAFLFAEDHFEFSTAIGYRRDAAKMRIGETYSSSDFLNGVELDWTMGIFVPKARVFFEADIGWYVSGSGNGALLLRPPSMPAFEGRFSHRSGGFFTDGQVNLGYPLGPSECQFVIDGSFGFFYQQIKQGACHPPICDLSHSRLKRFWFGPGLGGELIFRPHFAWIFSAGYLYYYLHFDQKFDLFSDLVYNAPLFSEYFIRQKFRASTPAHGQKISGKIAAQVAAEWRLNLRFDAFLFSAQNKTSSLRQNYTQVFPADALFSEVHLLETNATWRAYSGLVEVEYFF